MIILYSIGNNLCILYDFLLSTARHNFPLNGTVYGKPSIKFLRILVSGESCGFPEASEEIVNSCPKNIAEWRKQSLLKNCTYLTTQHNCSEPKPYVYHCLLNHFRNTTVEVCAQESRIFSGHCAEYNFLGKIIQTNHEAKCKQCPKIYNSGDVYKYQECYNFTRQQSDETTESGNSKWNITANNTKMNFQDASHPQDKSTNAATIFVIILGVLLAFFVFLSLAFLIWKRKKRQKRRSQELNPDLPNTSDPGCDIELIPKDDGSSNSREENLDDSKSCKQTRCVLEDSVMKCVKCCVSFETRDDNKFREENNDEDDIIHKKQYLKPMYTISASEIN